MATPTYKLSLGGTVIRERLTHLVALDRSGFAGDTLMLKLDAEDLAVPRRGVPIECEIGYEETGTWSLGSFVVENVKLKGPPTTFVVTCVSYPQGESAIASLQTTKEERSWQSYAVAGTTFGEVVGKVCSDVGLSAQVDGRLSAIEMPYVRQSNESDAAFLHRLTVERNGIVKINGDVVVFETRDQRRLGSIVVALNESVMDFSFDLNERYNIRSVRAKYQDMEAGEIRSVTIGEGKGVKVMSNAFPDLVSAQDAAESLLKHYQRNFVSGTLKMPTEPGLLAEKLVNLTGFPGGEDTNNQFVVVLAKHTYLRTSGLFSELQLKRVQEDVS